MNIYNVLGHVNQFAYNGNDGSRVFQSYNSVCAIVEPDGTIILGRDWDYSPTTLKHLKAFLGISDSKKEIQKKIDSGVYKYNPELR